MKLPWLEKLFGGEQEVAVKEKTPEGKSPAEKSPEEEVLSSKEKKSSKKLKEGITESSFVELRDDGAGIFKEIDYQNERAAYLVDRFLGLGLVPPTVIREIDGQIGSFQKFVEDAKMGYELPKEALDNIKTQQDLMKMWIFDIIIMNVDRHDGNYLIKDHAARAIDHGRILGWGRDEDNLEDSSNPQSFDYYAPYQMHVHGDYFNKNAPPDLIEQFNHFLAQEENQKLLRDLLAELVGKARADICLRRIGQIGEMLIRHGQIPKPENL